MHAGQGRPRPLDATTVGALCAGVMLALWSPALLPLVAASGLLASALVVIAVLTFIDPWRSAVRAAWVAWAAWLALGVALCTVHGHFAMRERLPAVLHGHVVTIEARVEGLPIATGRGSRFHVTVLRVAGVASPDVPLGVARSALEGRRLALRWFGGGQALRPGEVWRWSVRIAPLPPPAGPAQADSGRRALLDGVAGQGTVIASAYPLRFAAPRGLHALRDAVSRRIVEALGERRARFVAALSVGDTRGLADDDWTWLRQFGLTHLIAISGFHVGLVAGLGALFVRATWWWFPTLALRFRRGPAAAVAATLVALAYAALAGFSLPTVRTVLMIAVVAAVQARRRRVPSMQALLLAITLIAIVDPFALLTPGFWLSCGGVAWLLWCLPHATSPFSPAGFMKAQWVATLGLMPIAAAFFLQVPITGPLANLVAIPWISLVVVPLSLLGTLMLPLSVDAAALPWALAATAMALLERALGMVPEGLAASHWIAQPAPWAVALAVLGIAIVLLPRGVAWRPAGWVLVLPLLFPRLPGTPEAAVDAVAFSLPRGDAVLLRSAGMTVLVDAGPNDAGLVDVLRAMGVARIDLRIATRGNAGRAGGIADVDAAFPPARVWHAPGNAADGERCEAGAQLRADGFQLDVLHPPSGSADRGPDAACVLRVRVGSRELWLASDSGRWVAHRWAGAPPPASTRVVWGAPAGLLAWQSALGADDALATRAPGPSLSRRWPAEALRVDHSGLVTLRLDAGHPRPAVLWRRGRERWWDGAAP